VYPGNHKIFAHNRKYFEK